MSDQSITSQSEPLFVLDDRTMDSRLLFIQEYCEDIPFDEEGKTWADVIFNNGQTPESLANLYENVEQANGLLLPQQGFLLACMRMLEIPRALFNSLPAQHQQLYYRGLLGLKERGMTPDQVALSFKFNKAISESSLPAGLLVDAGQDNQGTPIYYSLKQTLLANQGILTDLRWCIPAPKVKDEASTGQVSRILCDANEGIALPPLGCRLFTYDQSKDQLAATGRVVASQVLGMSGGKRSISVRFASAIKQTEIVAEVSSNGQWLALQAELPPENPPANTLFFTLPDDAGPITPPNGLDDFDNAVPLLKISRDDGLSVPVIETLVAGAENSPDILMSTDDGVAAPNELCYPFGLEPVLGLGINLTAADWCNKSCPIQVTLTPEWLGLPGVSFQSWYANYPSVKDITNNNVFKVQASLPSGEVQPSSPLSLFQSGNDVPQPANLVITLIWTPSPAVESADPRNWPRYVRLDLAEQDFLQQEYWVTLSKNSNTGPLNPPYTPQWKSLNVAYSCTDSALSQQYVLTPFGHCLHAIAPDWLIQQELAASASKVNRGFGIAASFSADCTTLAVGEASLEYHSGPVCLYGREGGSWALQQQLNISSGGNTQFGLAVSLSPDGTLLAVGAPADLDFAGAVYIFSRDTHGWILHKRLIAQGGTTEQLANGRFGIAVQFNGDGTMLAVGACLYNGGRGAVYVFNLRENSMDWHTTDYQRIAPDLDPSSSFGYSTALSADGNYLAVQSLDSGGAAYVYRRTDSGWEKQKTFLIAKTTPILQTISLNADGTVLAVGGMNNDGQYVYVYRRTVDEWGEAQEVQPSDSSTINFSFGSSVSLSMDGQTLAVGCCHDSEMGNHAGAVYLFRYDGTAWADMQKCTALGAAANDNFGLALSLSANGEMLVVGAPKKQVGTANAVGMAYIFYNQNKRNQLYLGFEGLQPGQGISLYWQLQSPQPLDITWQYLNQDNLWQALNALILDQTDGLFYSGLWSVASLPSDISADVQDMPSGRYWIRGLMTPIQPTAASLLLLADAQGGEVPSDYPWLQGILTNGALAILANGNMLDPSHFDQPLPAGTITKPRIAIEGLEQIVQPWSSEGGRGPEEERAFTQRVAQLLSHRGRASSWQDIQILLLDQYPQVYDVRIPATGELSGADYRKTQILVVVPVNGQQDNADVLRPAFNAARLDRMCQYILNCASPWLDLQLANPTYINVQVQYQVIFTVGTNEEYGYSQLQLALEQHYMPWSWDGVSTVSLGYTLDYYDVVATIQQQPFVDRVVALTLDGENTSVQCQNTEVLILQFPRQEPD